ncbi:MAG: GNAT family N-acetyltransferase [Comamonas sp.]|jgi:predicted acetyltransferase|nr:GNAT family N-acetyltransferase [Comamonas sp.]
MKIEIEAIPCSSQSELQTLLFDYLTELGVDAEYAYLPLYWTEPGRFPYFILADGQVAGFALIRTLDESPIFEMAEFCVSKSHRGLAVGRAAARNLFAKHQGHWRVTVMPENLAGLQFWRSVVPHGTPVILSETPGQDSYMLMSFSTVQV